MLGKNFDPSTGTQRPGGFVETDVPIATQPQKLNIDAARINNALFVAATLHMHIRRSAIGHVGAFLVDIDMLKKMLPHEPSIGLIMRRGQADIFVEVESRDLTEIEPLVAMHADQFLIELQRGASGGEAEHGVRFFSDYASDNLGGEEATGLGVFADEDFHDCRLGSRCREGKLKNCHCG